MHIPDGFLSPPAWATLGTVSAPAIAWAARRAARDTLDHRLPLLGVMGAFVFAAQMINFPVSPATSGHLVGGALLAIVLGPAAAALVMTAILALQALLFQDGGILALGANVFNLALAGVAAGYLPCRLWGRTTPAIFLGGFLSVMTAGAFTLAELLASGVPLPARLVWLSLGLFFASALLEGGITVAAVRSIERLSPATLIDRGVSRLRTAVALAALVVVVGGTVVASTRPDGLQYAAAQIGLQETPAWIYAPLSGYEAAGLDSAWARKAGAGLIGLVLVYGVCTLGARKR